MCLPKSREKKVRRTSSIPDPSLHGFQHGSGGGLKWGRATSLSWLQSEKRYGLKKDTFFYFTIESMQKKQATRLEHLKYLKASQEEVKQAREL